MLSLPSHLKCNFLIVSKFVLDVNGRVCDDAGSDDVPLDSESGLWSDGIELSSSADWTCYSPLSASFHAVGPAIHI